MEESNLLLGTVVGILGGYFLGTFIYSFLITMVQWHPKILFVICILVCIGIVFFITYISLDCILIIVTSFIGGYSIMRGFTFIFKHYPSESQLIDVFSKGEKEEAFKLITWHFVVYIVSWLIVSFLGMFVQFKMYMKMKENEKDLKLSSDDALTGLTRK